jgi:hypothetical protein
MKENEKNKQETSRYRLSANTNVLIRRLLFKDIDSPPINNSSAEYASTFCKETQILNIISQLFLSIIR